MITQLRKDVFVETFEEQRQIDVAKLRKELEQLKTEHVEVKKVPDQETLDYWNNEVLMRNESTEARINHINTILQKVKDAGFLIEKSGNL